MAEKGEPIADLGNSIEKITQLEKVAIFCLTLIFIGLLFSKSELTLPFALYYFLYLGFFRTEQEDVYSYNKEGRIETKTTTSSQYIFWKRDIPWKLTVLAVLSYVLFFIGTFCLIYSFFLLR